MIVYPSSAFGFRNLLRVHGSPVYKVLFPTLISTGWVVAIDQWRTPGDRIAVHPYVVGALVGFFSFLLTFRLNFAYGRYWEAATSVHQMTSKWLDTAILLCAFHYQSEQFAAYKPPAFGSNPKVVSMDVERELRANAEETVTLDQKRNTLKKRNAKGGAINESERQDINSGRTVEVKYLTKSMEDGLSKIPIPVRFRERFSVRASAVDLTLNPAVEAAPNGAEEEAPEGKYPRQSARMVLTHSTELPPPSLFLQELAHLISLMFAVALSTLRNDIEGAESPLTEYIPGKPWPPVNPDLLANDLKHKYGGDSMFWTSFYFMFGISRSVRHRTLYNAARPFPVLGGVSDLEIDQLQAARGPYAKTMLCTFWFKEFMSRELLNGSVGQVHHALLSRLYQYTSDGCIGYNQARKVAYVPFPFPHAQLTALYSLGIMFVFPSFFQSYITNLGFACFINFFTVLGFLGLHEVARELENPFSNVPNDLPLVTFQAQVNEALVTMYAGYHPDAYWTIRDVYEKKDE